MDSVNVTLDVNLFVMVAVIIVYLGAVAFLSWLGRIKSRGDDFASGGRNIPSAVMALSYGAAFISTSAIVGFGGMAAEIGMSLIWLAGANIFFGIFLAFAVFGKRTRAVGLTLDAHTFPEFLSKRFASPFIRYFTAVVMIVSMPLYAAAVLIGAARILESLLGVPYEYALAAFSLLVAVYVLIGGLRGVMYTDALQGTLMIAGMLFLLVAMFIKLGGPIDAFSKLHAMKELVPPESAAAGHQGWLSDPKVFSPVWWTLYSSLVFGVGVGVLAQPHLAVRCLTVKTSAELNRAAAVGGVFILITVATPYVLGALSNVFFYEKDGVLASVAAGHNVDSVIPLLIKQAMPGWFSYFFMLVILSAAVSTLSSQFHAIGVAFGRDVLEAAARGRLSRRSSVLISRIGIVAAVLLTVFLSMKMGAGIIARATSIFFGIMASGWLAPFLLSLYWQRLTKAGAIAGMVSGLTAALIGFLLFHESESAVFGLAQLLTGNPAVVMNIFRFVDPLVYALPISLFFTVVVSFFTKVTNADTVKKCFQNIKNMIQ